MEVIISKATQKNWARLNVSCHPERLTKRANKTNSRKKILPLEYFSDANNLPIINALLDEINCCGADIFSAMYSIVLNCFNCIGIADGTKADKKNVQDFISEYSCHTLIKSLISSKLPINETDLLGLIYQSTYMEGDKNKQGLYYTPMWLSKQLSERLSFLKGETLLDPCCGSGSFLLNAQGATPTQLYGVDCDPIAVMLCKANLIMRYQEIEFTPQVYLTDYLTEPGFFDAVDELEIKSRKFDYIATNPPWGAIIKNNLVKESMGESFSCFLFTALDSLTDNGLLIFLLPESLLNVKTHSYLRSKLLCDYSVKQIELFPNLFSGVTSKVVSLTVSKKHTDGVINVCDGKRTFTVNSDVYKQNAHHVFSLIDSYDRDILNSLYFKGQFTLSDSIFALGIVTGNNAEKLFDAPLENSEPIYTGKEIKAFKLMSPQKHIVYDRSQFQQIAKDEIYRAKEKLVYKFISSKLVFAYDDSGSLFLNSANILIPDVPFMSVQSVLLLLNSELFQFAYLKKFGEIKILKGNLCELPLPKLLSEENSEWSAISNSIIKGNDCIMNEAQEVIYQYYSISQKQANYIKEALKNGKSA
ncbi:MAG: N-6 DNA methylase [Lachnospiraceae bacterium]|jgi:16S rRNA G966 N2-methylase RsmD|nr:N-6 DNA methylase [Lachnospiraceae bacterium]